MALSMELTTQVKPGTVSCNFAEFKASLQKELDENYKSIVVTEDGLKFARDERATLNKVKQGLAAAVKSIKEQNNLTIESALAQAKELDAMLDEAIDKIGSQIKAIEAKQREGRMKGAMDILAQKIERTNDDQLIAFAAGCEWLQNPKWANSDCTFKQVNDDCAERVSRIKQALELLSDGEYAPQMLSHFQKTGDLAASQLLGKKMAKEQDLFSSIVEKKPEATTIPKKEINIVYDEPVEKESVTVKAPITYRKDEKSDKTCRADFRIRGSRYVLEWFMDVCSQFNISLERLDK